MMNAANLTVLGYAAAFIINSIARKIEIALRRSRAPARPITKSAPDASRTSPIGIPLAVKGFPPAVAPQDREKRGGESHDCSRRQRLVNRAVGALPDLLRHVQEHQHEEEEDQDGARVHDDLDRRNERCREQDISDRESEERHDEREHALDGMAVNDHHAGEQNREAGGRVEDEPRRHKTFHRTSAATQKRFSSARGSRAFQPSRMSWSYRKRGSVQRTHMNTQTKNAVLTAKITTERRTAAALAGVKPGRLQPPKYSVTMSAAAVLLSVVI